MAQENNSIIKKDDMPRQAKFLITLDDSENEVHSEASPTSSGNSSGGNESAVKAISQRLNKFIKENFTSKADFVNKTGISAEEMLEYFGHKKPVNYYFLKRMAELGCDLNWLIYGKDSLEPENKKDTPRSAEEEITELKTIVTKQLEVINDLEQKITELQKENTESELSNDRLKEEVLELLERRLKKVMFENLGIFQKNVVNDLVTKADIFTQIDEIFTKKKK